MTNEPYQHLAKEFLDLWQKQMASVVGDKQFLHAMLEMIQSIKTPHANTTKRPTSYTADASGDDGADNAQLAYRLSQCERRLAALEKGAAKGPAKPKISKKPRKPR